jgi:alpha-galactosidase
MKGCLLISWLLIATMTQAQVTSRSRLAPLPPMGWMTWNLYGDRIDEGLIRGIADAMDSTGMATMGYRYLIIDDGWQGGRDRKNNIIADPVKFPSGMKALADYVHAKGLKLGIYSDAAPLTCAGYTASLGFEEQDAKTFASWGIDYLKYDYCNAPEDSNTAKIRYTKMAEALSASGRDIVFGICEWGGRQPWFWAANAGGSLWRTTGDVRDKWKAKPGESGEGIMDILAVNASLDEYAAPGKWNDPDMLVVGLYGAKGPSSDLGGIGCSDAEYQSQMSLWCIMAAPLIATNNIRAMNEATKRILLNPEAIAIDQDPAGIQGKLIKSDSVFDLLLKPLQNGDWALAILNKSGILQSYSFTGETLGLSSGFTVRDVWEHRNKSKKGKWTGAIQSHETKLFRLIKSRP